MPETVSNIWDNSIRLPNILMSFNAINYNISVVVPCLTSGTDMVFVLFARPFSCIQFYCPKEYNQFLETEILFKREGDYWLPSIINQIRKHSLVKNFNLPRALCGPYRWSFHLFRVNTTYREHRECPIVVVPSVSRLKPYMTRNVSHLRNSPVP